VVSDAQSAYALPELRAVALADYFAATIISGDYGYRKPDPRLFQAALTPPRSARHDPDGGDNDTVNP